MRTNIVINESLLEEARRLTGLKTKRAVVEKALETLIRFNRQLEILDLKGKVTWEGDLGEMREGRVFDADSR